MDNHVEIVYKKRQCAFTFCGEPQGIGTWMQIGLCEDANGIMPVCEGHWRALRTVR